MRVVSSQKIVESAEQVIQGILETYQAPNRTLIDVRNFMNSAAVKPLHDFSTACRVELHRFGAS